MAWLLPRRRARTASPTPSDAASAPAAETLTPAFGPDRPDPGPDLPQREWARLPLLRPVVRPAATMPTVAAPAAVTLRPVLAPMAAVASARSALLTLDVPEQVGRAVGLVTVALTLPDPGRGPAGRSAAPRPDGGGAVTSTSTTDPGTGGDLQPEPRESSAAVPDGRPDTPAPRYLPARPVRHTDESLTVAVDRYVGEPTAAAAPFHSLTEMDRMAAQFESMSFGEALALINMSEAAGTLPMVTPAPPPRPAPEQARRRSSLAESRRLGLDGLLRRGPDPAFSPDDDAPGPTPTVETSSSDVESGRPTSSGPVSSAPMSSAPTSSGSVPAVRPSSGSPSSVPPPSDLPPSGSVSSGSAQAPPPLDVPAPDAPDSEGSHPTAGPTPDETSSGAARPGPVTDGPPQVGSASSNRPVPADAAGVEPAGTVADHGEHGRPDTSRPDPGRRDERPPAAAPTGVPEPGSLRSELWPSASRSEPPRGAGSAIRPTRLTTSSPDAVPDERLHPGPVGPGSSSARTGPGTSVPHPATVPDPVDERVVPERGSGLVAEQTPGPPADASAAPYGTAGGAPIDDDPTPAFDPVHDVRSPSPAPAPHAPVVSPPAPAPPAAADPPVSPGPPPALVDALRSFDRSGSTTVPGSLPSRSDVDRSTVPGPVQTGDDGPVGSRSSVAPSPPRADSPSTASAPPVTGAEGAGRPRPVTGPAVATLPVRAAPPTVTSTVPADLAEMVTRRWGIDTRDVVVHRGTAARTAATALRAASFTRGGEIYLPDEAGPSSGPRSRALLAHELTHVAQQRALGPALPTEESAAGRLLEADAVAAEHEVLGDAPELRHRTPSVPTAPVGQTAQIPSAPVAPSPLPSDSSTVLREEPASSATSWSLDGGFRQGPTPPPITPTPPVQRAPASGSEPDDPPGADRSDRVSEQLEELSGRVDRLAKRADAELVDTYDARELDLLAGRLYRHIRGHLRAELLIDRERSGRLADLQMRRTP